MNGTFNMITFTIITMASSRHFSFHFLIVILNLPFFVSFFDPSITLAGGAAPFPIHPPSSSVIDFVVTIVFIIAIIAIIAVIAIISVIAIIVIIAINKLI